MYIEFPPLFDLVYGVCNFLVEIEVDRSQFQWLFKVGLDLYDSGNDSNVLELA